MARDKKQPILIQSEKEGCKELKPYARGYSTVRRKVERGNRYTMSCFNCEYFYQAPGDDIEVCQNPDVLKYDMVVSDSTIYCHLWEITSRRTDAKTLFRKRRGE